MQFEHSVLKDGGSVSNVQWHENPLLGYAAARGLCSICGAVIVGWGSDAQAQYESNMKKHKRLAHDAPAYAFEPD